MTGVIPLDKNDEGLEPVDIVIDINDIYHFFDHLFAEHDIQRAAEFYLE